MRKGVEIFWTKNKKTHPLAGLYKTDEGAHLNTKDRANQERNCDKSTQ